MVKFLVNEEVYVPISEIEKKGISLPFTEGDVVDVEPFGKAVPERIYSALLESNPDALEANGGHVEVTKVNSLSWFVENDRGIRPLKVMFLSGSFGMTRDEIERKLDAEDAETIERKTNSLAKDSSRVSDRYAEKVSEFAGKAREISESLARAGLEVQFATEVGESGIPRLECAVVGENAFIQIYPYDWVAEDFEEVRRLPDGSVSIPSFDVEDGFEVYVPNPATNRDFRKFSYYENLIWCATNLDVRNDFQDELNYRKDGIDFSMNLRTLVRAFNGNAFRETFMFDGTTTFDEVVSTTFMRQQPAAYSLTGVEAGACGDSSSTSPCRLP